MKIAIFTDTYEPQINGVVTSIKSFAEELRRNGDEVYIFCPYAKGLKRDKFIIPLRSFSCFPQPEYRVGLPSLRVIRYMKKINPDVVHVQSQAIVGLAGIIVAKHFKKPIVVTYHTLHDKYFQYLPGGKNKLIRKFHTKWFISFLKIFFNNSDIFIVPSNDTKKDIVKKGYKGNAYSIPTGIKQENHVLRKNKNEVPIILHVGRLCSERSVDVVIRAFAEFLKKTEGQLIITSKGPGEEELKDLVNELNIENKVKFTGYVSEEELKRIYRKSDVFVTASTTDTQSLVVLESMNFGTPVIAPNAGGIKDYVKDEVNGLLFKGGDFYELAEKMHTILNNSKLRREITMNGFKTAEDLSIERCSDKLRNIYIEAINKKVHKIKQSL